MNERDGFVMWDQRKDFKEKFAKIDSDASSMTSSSSSSSSSEASSEESENDRKTLCGIRKHRVSDRQLEISQSQGSVQDELLKKKNSKKDRSRSR